MPVADGTAVLFNCTSERAYPIPMFEWYKNEKLIQRYGFQPSLLPSSNLFFILVFSSLGTVSNNQTGSASFSSSSLLTLSLSPADHDQTLRCQVTNEASIHDTNVELKLDVLCKYRRLIKSHLNILFDQCDTSS